MRRALTAEEMRLVDRRTTEQIGIPSLLLMENAASAVVRELEARFAPLREQRVVVLCGKGANGGDGLAIARLLKVRGIAPDLEVALLADPAELQGDAETNYRMARGVGLSVPVVSDSASWSAFRERVARATLVVDAILGTGLRGPARGLAGQVISELTEFTHVAFAAVDTPSGMPSDGGSSGGPACPADVTVTFTAPKAAQIVLPWCERLGDLRVAPIGSPDRFIEAIEGDPLYLLDRGDAAPYCRAREKDGHKGSFGHVGVVGGSRSKPGAAAMAGMAAARSGAGLTTVVTPAGAASAVIATCPELMTVPVAEAPDGSISAADLSPESLQDFSVLVIGPGLGIETGAVELVRRLVSQIQQPVVVDADGLTALSQSDEWDFAASTVVLTPHPGEMARLAGITASEVQADRIGLARRFAVERRVLLVLKGARTVIADPTGRVFVNPTGGPGMATGGSGDILAGMIGGFLAQFPDADPALAISAGVFLHGLAGDIAANRRTEQAMLATDILEFLPRALESVQDDPSPR